MPGDLDRVKFGRILKRMIKLAGLTQHDVAQELDVTQQYVSQILSGKTALPELTFEHIVELLRPRLRPEDVDFLVDNYVVSTASPGKQPIPVARTEYGDAIQLTALDMLFLKKFKQLLDAQQLKVMQVIEQLERDNEVQMARNAGLEP